jgi:hypothetical protein
MPSENVNILATPTATRLGPDTAGSVVVCGSHAAIYTTYLTISAGARAAIHHDASFGLDRAGVAGLAWCEPFGLAMAAVDARSARIGDGADMLQRGVISAANRHAAACGVVPGMPCSEAAARLRAAPLATSSPAPMLETRSVITPPGAHKTIAMVDSIALAREGDAGAIVVSGSHGGTPSDGYAAKIGMQLVLFNDAGFGAEYAGIAALPILQQRGIAAAAVSAFTARIGDGRSTYENGIISAANAAAVELGAVVGSPARDFIDALAGR